MEISTELLKKLEMDLIGICHEDGIMASLVREVLNSRTTIANRLIMSGGKSGDENLPPHGSKMDLQDEIREWGRRNFPGTTEADYPLVVLGIVEELGELQEPIMMQMLMSLAGKLAHANLKEVQAIRGTPEEHQKAAKDALADMMIFMYHYCALRGWRLDDLVEETWDKVRQRDWQKNQLTGQIS